jgi:hypothetical protein
MTFTVGVLTYNAIAGVCYAAFNALGLELVGSSHPVAATQPGLFSAATNAAIAYMTWFDGRGYHLRGVTGLLLVDGVASIVTAAVLIAVWQTLTVRDSARRADSTLSG